MRKFLVLGLIGLLTMLVGCSLNFPTAGKSDNPPAATETANNQSQEAAKDVKTKDPSLVPVVKVISGDEFVVKNSKGAEETVRLIGVAVLNSKEAQKKALDFAKANLEGKEVRLEADKQDKDSKGNLFRYVYLDDGTFYNRLLLEEGLARTTETKINVAHKEEFIQVEKATAKARQTSTQKKSDDSIKTQP